jgi:hypothetical protein
MKQECQKCEPEKWAHKENGQTIMLCDEHWNKASIIEITPSGRIDWCGACKKEHGYNCPKVTPHTHGEHESHTRVEFTERYRGFVQFICLDDGVIYKELEITREGK